MTITWNSHTYANELVHMYKEYKCKGGEAHQHYLLCLKWGLSFWLLVIKLVTGQDTTTYALDKCPKKLKRNYITENINMISLLVKAA